MYLDNENENIANIFMVSNHKNSFDFIEKFIKSDILKEIENQNPWLLYKTPDEIINLYNQCETKKDENKKEDRLPEEKMYWIGYMYSYLSQKYKTTIPKILEKIGPKELSDLFALLHEVDYETAANRIHLY